jgi:RNA polymerase-binding transcription factor DksA
MLSKEFIEDRKEQLLALKAQLSNELSGLKPHTELGNDFDDLASELQIDEVNQDLILRIEQDLSKIDLALERIALGTYGIDDDGNEISEERLVAMPYADKAV